MKQELIELLEEKDVLYIEHDFEFHILATREDVISLMYNKLRDVEHNQKRMFFGYIYNEDKMSDYYIEVYKNSKDIDSNEEIIDLLRRIANENNKIKREVVINLSSKEAKKLLETIETKNEVSEEVREKIKDVLDVEAHIFEKKYSEWTDNDVWFWYEKEELVENILKLIEDEIDVKYYQWV